MPNQRQSLLLKPFPMLMILQLPLVDAKMLDVHRLTIGQLYRSEEKEYKDNLVDFHYYHIHSGYQVAHMNL
ncbi:hypothetical protein D3C87_1844770 [compost metagenome]